jgi:two-component system, NarL family, nitrate/nitrite response regulator NarL
VKPRAVVYSPVRLFADGVTQCLNDRSAAEVEACYTLDSLDVLLAQRKVDILLFDVTTGDALAAARSLISRYPEIRAVALALPEIPDQVIACVDLGFTSYIPPNATVNELCDIVDRALREEVICAPAVACGLIRELHRRSPAVNPWDPEDQLTRREHEVLTLMSQGLSNKEIAKMLGLSVATVKNHVHSVLGKSNLSHRSQTFGKPHFHPRIRIVDQPQSGTDECADEDHRCAAATSF